jgi:predicted transcriptional regulator
MSESREYSCFDCPLICEISKQVAESGDVREATVAESYRAMERFAEVDEHDATHEVLRTRWAETSSQIFSLLDDADKVLATNRTALLETCDDQKPLVLDEKAVDREPTLVCGSVLAERVMNTLNIKKP